VPRRNLKKIRQFAGIFMQSLYASYLAEIDEEERHCAGHRPDLITGSDIATLPRALQKHLLTCGYVGGKIKSCARIIWNRMEVRSSPLKKWKVVSGWQFNGITLPSRVVYMKSRAWGLVPIEGRDKYQASHGNMLIRVGKLFTAANAAGPEMDASGLVTILSESMLIPSYILQPYIKWLDIDEYTVAAVLRYAGIEVGGLFHFNERGQFSRFESNDRYFVERNGGYRKMKWSAHIGTYRERQGVLIPSEVSASWHPGGEPFNYFRGEIEDIV
jgi:hypothetical protein